MGSGAMSATAHPKLALRPYLPVDAPLLAEIFRASVEELTQEDYSAAQRAAWSATAEDEDAFGKKLAGRLTLIATLDGSPVGFVALEGAEHIDMLYVHPAAVGRGVGKTLCDAVEKLAQARKAARLTVDASDTARGFFEHRGYEPQRRNTVTVGGEWLANTTLEKKLSAPEQPVAS
jgi:putative acetyltransferase